MFVLEGNALPCIPRISSPMSTSKPDQNTHVLEDPIPNPEPASPSLDKPDPGVFHHEPEEHPLTPPATHISKAIHHT